MTEPELRTTTDWKNFGNKQFVLKRYSDALKAYSVGLTLCNNEDADLLTNRAAAYLNLEHFQQALDDTNLVLQSHPNHAKAIFRKGKALCGLSKCEEALTFLKSCISNNKPSKELGELLERAEVMRDQQFTQQYDVTEHFYHYFHKIENWAEYFGPTVVKDIPGKGRGLIATKNIAEGQLVFCTRAFAIEFHDPDVIEEVADDFIGNDPSISSLHDKGGCMLVQRIYDRIKQVPELGKQVYQLYAGPEFGTLDPSKDDCSIPDPKRISGIVRYNCFCNTDDDSDSEKSSGLFIAPSFYNHRCVGQNCTWRVFGNFIMIRAFRPIAKGQELLISYASPTWTYKVRQGLLNDRLGFHCFCELCTLDAALPKEVINVREKLVKLALKQSVDFVGLNPDAEDASEIYKRFQESSSLLLEILKRLEDLHPNHGIYNVLTLDALQQLGMKYFGVGEFDKAADCMLRAHAIMMAVGLPHGGVECMLWIVGAHLQLNNTKLAKHYILQLKKDAYLAHGTLKTLRLLGEWVINAMEDHNVAL